MRKYTFVLHHSGYEDFLSELQRLGVVHIIRNTKLQSDKQLAQKELMDDYTSAVKYLTKLGSEAEKGSTNLPPKALLNRFNAALEEKDTLKRQEELLKKQIHELEPWGHFDYDLETRLEAQGITVDFHTCLKNHFKQEWKEKFCVEVINEVNGLYYFVLFHTGDAPPLECDTFSFHKHTLQELETNLEQTRSRVADIDQYFMETAPGAIDVFKAEIGKIASEYDYEDAIQQGKPEVEDVVRVLGGWIPSDLEAELRSFLDAAGVIYFAADGKVEDNPPIILRNSWFARLFEPIGNLYMLPSYNEFDLTPFFAPFFMLFFGFCNADAAYGIIIIALGLFMRHKAKTPAMRGMAMLIIIFGISSTVMGWVMGSLLGYDLKKISTLERFIPIKDNDMIFRFALLLGAIQILFGVGINAVKKARQFGFVHGVAPVGIFLFIASLAVMGSEMFDADISAVKPYLTYTLLGGLALLLLFNKPGKNPIINVLGGLWLLYNVITGFFGDILSYIRLFALGVSSTILGFVINSIGSQMLDIYYVGPIVFVIFMIFGHALNIALGALSGFVHPMRLTFVEFYKNADFQGPGLQYKPFGKQHIN
jgi:V/A-type H+-transporting ATPase subunit I